MNHDTFDKRKKTSKCWAHDLFFVVYRRRQTYRSHLFEKKNWLNYVYYSEYREIVHLLIYIITT